jgi:adenylate cyclase
VAEPAGPVIPVREAARRAGITPATLRRWARSGVFPEGGVYEDGLSPAAAAHARLVSRLRNRGHSLEEIRRAASDGRLAYGFIEDVFPHTGRARTLAEAAEESGLEQPLIERIWMAFGLPQAELDHLTDEDVQALQYAATVLDAGFPLVAFLQLTRVYGQTLSQIADAETRLFHIYVHEPLMREGVGGLEMAEAMEHLARDLIPLASPLMDFIHQRFLQHYVEQDVVGHMEMDLEEGADEGRLRVAICFADLAGYVRLTEEEGDEEALSYIERFIDGVHDTLPDDARVVKTIGDEVMVVSSDVQGLTDWAVGFQGLFRERPQARIGIHYGRALYRDGDYFGRDVNVAARVVARARGGEVIVTDSVIDAVTESDHLEFEEIGQVKLKGFDEPRLLCRAHAPRADGDG